MVAVQHTDRKWTSHLVEQRSIDYVPPSERHGRVRDQFTVWTAANATALNIFFGSLAILLGLNFVWAVVAIVVGTVLGALMTSLHALQGPEPEPGPPPAGGAGGRGPAAPAAGRRAGFQGRRPSHRAWLPLHGRRAGQFRAGTAVPDLNAPGRSDR